jgi:hypothetical protein
MDNVQNYDIYTFLMILYKSVGFIKFMFPAL